MRKILYSVLCILYSVSAAVLCPLSANVIEGVAAIPDGYYDGVSGKKGADNILNALQTCISKDYNEISYKGLEPHYLKTDFYADTLWDTYSTCRFTYEMANIPQKNVCDGWNKEHVCCQSWLGSGPMVSDMFNVYPTDARVNNLRSNYPYGVVGTNKGISGDPDHHALGKLGTSTANGVGTVYEPDDRYKGDFARTFFYMVARYRDKILNSGDGSTMFTSSPTNLTAYSLAFLLDWHRNDPVSQKEIDRNQAVYGEQNNRNPFIDYPELVEYIWGDLKGQAVDLASMTPTCDGGSGSTAVKYGVTWILFGQVLRVDSVKENSKPQSVPTDPEEIGTLCIGHETFVGWTTEPINTPIDMEPALYREPADFPPVTADVTYYAVFAHQETTQSESVPVVESINMKAQGFGNGEEVTTVKQNDVTVTFSKGTSTSNVPKYYNTGEAVRCYAGNSFTVSAEAITRIDITFGSGESTNEITVMPGVLINSSWVGLTDEVVFKISGSSGNRRIAQLDVTMNGSGETTTYSAYTTTCSGTGDMEQNEPLPVFRRKIIRSGQLLIQVGDQIYTITGQKVQ